MGLPAVNGHLPSHKLVAEAVIINLAKPKKQRTRAEGLLAKMTSWNLILALRDNKLNKFYWSLLQETHGDEFLSRNLSMQQRHVVIDRCMREWLVAVESAISYLQHCINKPKEYPFSAYKQKYMLNLRKVSQLRTFLYRELELPLHSANPDKPNYEGLVSNAKRK